MRFRIIPPIGNTRSPLNVETLLNSLHKSLRSASTVSLFLESEGGRVGYAAEVPDEQRILSVQELQDAYPRTLVKVREREPESSDRQVWHASLQLRPDLLAIRTYDQFVDFAEDRLLADPVAGLLASSAGTVLLLQQLSRPQFVSSLLMTLRSLTGWTYGTFFHRTPFASMAPRSRQLNKEVTDENAHSCIHSCRRWSRAGILR